MRSLLFSAAVLLSLAGPPAADAATIYTPTLPDRYTYVVMTGAPKDTFVGYFEANKDSSSNTLVWSLDSTCSKMFAISAPRGAASLRTKTEVPYYKEEQYKYCKLYVDEAGTVSVARFTVVIVLKSYRCLFKENAPNNTVCSTFLHNASGIHCSPPGLNPGLGALFEAKGYPCRIRTRTNLNRETITRPCNRITVSTSFMYTSTFVMTFNVTIGITDDVTRKFPSCSPPRPRPTGPEGHNAPAPPPSPKPYLIVLIAIAGLVCVAFVIALAVCWYRYVNVNDSKHQHQHKHKHQHQHQHQHQPEKVPI